MVIVKKIYKIKPLEWVKCFNSWYAYNIPLGKYRITEEEGRWIVSYYFEWRGHIDCKSLSDAKQKAQADWRKKLETCLEEAWDEKE